jgi:hypothetical protein
MVGIRGSSMPQNRNFLDLDPTYQDAWGQPLLRMTFDFPRNDSVMANYMTAKGGDIGKRVEKVDHYLLQLTSIAHDAFNISTRLEIEHISCLHQNPYVIFRSEASSPGTRDAIECGPISR